MSTPKPLTQTAPPAAGPAIPSSLVQTAGGLIALMVFFWLLGMVRKSGKRTVRGKVDPTLLAKALKRYVTRMDVRLRQASEIYSSLLASRNLVAGYYESRGSVIGVRLQVKKAYCNRCRKLDGLEISLLDAEVVASHTPPLHGELGRGKPVCEALLIAIPADTTPNKGQGRPRSGRKG
ncbi:MAG: hypothetical protein VKP72_12730 [bacterium]|nr:hypothetical protein [bacterium]